MDRAGDAPAVLEGNDLGGLALLNDGGGHAHAVRIHVRPADERKVLAAGQQNPVQLDGLAHVGALELVEHDHVVGRDLELLRRNLDDRKDLGPRRQVRPLRRLDRLVPEAAADERGRRAHRLDRHRRRPCAPPRAYTQAAPRAAASVSKRKRRPPISLAAGAYQRTKATAPSTRVGGAMLPLRRRAGRAGPRLRRAGAWPLLRPWRAGRRRPGAGPRRPRRRRLRGATCRRSSLGRTGRAVHWRGTTSTVRTLSEPYQSRHQ